MTRSASYTTLTDVTRGGGRGSPTPSSDAAAPATTRVRTGSARRDTRTTRASSPPSTTTRAANLTAPDAPTSRGRVCEPYESPLTVPITYSAVTSHWRGRAMLTTTARYSAPSLGR